MRLTLLVSLVAFGCTVQTDRARGGDDGGGGLQGGAGGGDDGAGPVDVGGGDEGEAAGGGDGGVDGGDPLVGEGEGEGEVDPGPAPTPLGAALEATPLALDLGEVPRGQAAEPGELTVTNVGDAASDGLTISLLGGDGFQIVEAPTRGDCVADQGLDPGASCKIGVTFAPAVGGPAVAALTVAGEVVLVSAVGIGFGPAALSAGDVVDHDFGVVEAPAMQDFTITNVGELPATDLQTVMAGAGFEAVEDTCEGATLDGGQACAVTVRFAPADASPHEGALHVLGPGPIEIGLRGRGVDPPPPVGPAVLGVDPVRLDFGPVLVGQEALAQVVRVRNTGESAAQGLSWELEGVEEFEVSVPRDGGCPQGGALAPETSCSLVVGFQPAARGPRRAAVAVGAQNVRAAFVDLVGVGEDPGGEPGLGDLVVAIPANGRDLDFGFAEAPVSEVIVLRNGGDGPTGSLITRIAGDPALSILAGDDDCVGRTLAPLAECRIEVSFRPVANGGVEATLTATSPDARGDDDTVTVGILGAGRGFDPAALELDPNAHDYGEIDVGERSGDEFFTLQNTGDLPARALRIAMGGDHPRDFEIVDVPNGCAEGADLPGGAACLLGARFVPQAGNARSGVLAVAADGVREPALVALAGTGHSLLNGDLGGIPFCFERPNSAGHRVGVFNSRNGQNPSQRHNGHANWRSFCQANGWDDHNRGAGNSNNTCQVLEDGYVTLRHLDAGGNWDEDDYPPNRQEGRGHVFHTCIIRVVD